jgi:hypothetical protein
MRSSTAPNLSAGPSGVSTSSHMFTLCAGWRHPLCSAWRWRYASETCEPRLAAASNGRACTHAISRVVVRRAAGGAPAIHKRKVPRARLQPQGPRCTACPTSRHQTLLKLSLKLSGGRQFTPAHCLMGSFTPTGHSCLTAPRLDSKNRPRKSSQGAFRLLKEVLLKGEYDARTHTCSSRINHPDRGRSRPPEPPTNDGPAALNRASLGGAPCALCCVL